jgi:hypothetical protein
VAVFLTGAKLGIWHEPVNTPITTSSHRPALKAARRCLRPLTVVSVHKDPGALKRRLITRRTARSTWPEPMGSFVRLQGHRAHAMRMDLQITHGPRDGLAPLLRGSRAQRLHHDLHPIRLVP